MKIHIAEKDCMVQMLEENVSEKTAAVEKGCKTIQYMAMKTKSLEHELTRLKGEGVSFFKVFFILVLLHVSFDVGFYAFFIEFASAVQF